MAFAIEISEVGEAEYPLLETLRSSIFSEFGHKSRSPIAQGLSHRHHLYVLIAHLEGNPLGFAAGYSRGPKLFYLNYLGVLGDYRRQGVGRRLLEQQEGFARSCGYPQMQFNTFNHFPSMIRLALDTDYRPVGVEQHFGTRWELSVRFEKVLLPDSEPKSTEPPQVQNPSRSEVRIPASNTQQLRIALERGCQIIGVVHQPGHNELVVVLNEGSAP